MPRLLDVCAEQHGIEGWDSKGDGDIQSRIQLVGSLLALVGVADFRKFLDVLNAIKTKRSADQKAALEAKLDGRKNPAQTSTKHGKIGGMKGDRISREQSKRTNGFCQKGLFVWFKNCQIITVLMLYFCQKI